MPSRLSDCLVREGTLPVATVRTAVARQLVYGGALDTVLLELDAIDEPTLWAALEHATGVPAPDGALFENPDPAAATAFDASWGKRCRAVPVGRKQEGTVQVLCGDPIDDAALAAARAALGLALEVYVVPEVRLAAARQAVYGEPMPPRLLRVLGRLLGAQPVRHWVEAQARARAAARQVETVTETVLEPVAAPAMETLTSTGTSTDTSADTSTNANTTTRTRTGEEGVVEERLCRVAQDAQAEARLSALRMLRTRLEHPSVRAMRDRLRGELHGPAAAAATAAEALGELRDPAVIPALVEVLTGAPALATAAHQALVAITLQDFGESRRKWSAWWERHQSEERAEWLFEALAHKSPEIRFAAYEELRLITGEYFGYHFDLPKREREEARERWHTWWRQSGRGRGLAGGARTG
jgi:hypothetical protein